MKVKKISCKVHILFWNLLVHHQIRDKIAIPINICRERVSNDRIEVWVSNNDDAKIYPLLHHSHRSREICSWVHRFRNWHRKFPISPDWKVLVELHWVQIPCKGRTSCLLSSWNPEINFECKNGLAWWMKVDTYIFTRIDILFFLRMNLRKFHWTSSVDIGSSKKQAAPFRTKLRRNAVEVCCGSSKSEWQNQNNLHCWFRENNWNSLETKALFIALQNDKCFL